MAGEVEPDGQGEAPAQDEGERGGGEDEVDRPPGGVDVLEGPGAAGELEGEQADGLEGEGREHVSPPHRWAGA